MKMTDDVVCFDCSIVSGGGMNDTDCHLDIPLRGCSLFLDGEPVLLDGAVVAKDLTACEGGKVFDVAG